MVGHASVTAIDPGVPASLSRPLLDGVVRGEWRFDGVMISDDLTMTVVYDRGLCDSAVQALAAGMDLLLIAYDDEKFYPTLDCLLQAQRDGRLPDLGPSTSGLEALLGSPPGGGAGSGFEKPIGGGI